MDRPRLQSLGQDAPPPPLPPFSSPLPPPPGRLEMLTVDGAAAAFACRSAAQHLSASCHFRMNDSAPYSTRRNHVPASVHPFATLRTSFQTLTYRIIQSFSCPSE